MTKKVLSIIPARGGSKGVPRKNTRILVGKPLVFYSIDAAIRSSVIDRLIVSTADLEIADVAKSCGAEVIMRPLELAGDKVLTEPVMLDVLNRVKDQGYIPEYVSLIQCTSPFITPDIIKSSVEKVTSENFDSCITVFMPDGYEFKWKKDKTSEQFIPEHDITKRLRRQDMDLPYHENGAFYITTRELFERTGNRFGGSGARVTAVEMSEQDSLQIDSQYNFWLAEKLMERKIMGLSS